MSVIEAYLVDMRHELRTPVNAILGYGQLLLEEHGDALSAEARHDIERVIEAGHHLLRIITDVLDEPLGDDISVCAARMRHALYTPLLTVQGLAYLLIEEQRGTEICDDLRRIDDAAVQLAKVSDSLEHSFRACVDAARNESQAAATTGPAPARPGLRPTDLSAAMADSPERLAARSGSIR